MPKSSQVVKQEIVERSIEDDQQFVAEQLFKTFKDNPADNLACTMTKLMLACVAKGDFKTSSSLLQDKTLRAPNNTFTISDYLSHASRLIFDYKGLSADHKNEFLAFFPMSGANIVSRSATHAVSREVNGIVEHKGFLLGVVGQLPALVKTPSDFGINIAVGGAGKLNLIGNQIADNGFSGHLY